MNSNQNVVTKKKHTLYSVFGIIGDIIFYPVIILSLLCSFLMFTSKKQGDVPQVFGVSLVSVLSGSMEKSGFYRGDTIFVKSIKTENLNVGDIIAFYYHYDSADANLELTLIDDGQEKNTNFVKDESFVVENRKSRKDLDKKAVKVYFHKIVSIYSDDGGTLFFETRGTSNASNDAYKVREDYVVGRYVNTPVWVRKIFHFCTTSLGMVLFVITPLSILIMLQSLSIIEQVNNILVEKKVIERVVDYNSEESVKANVGIEMDLHSKIYFYSIVSEKEREDVWKFLWNHLKSSNNKKDIFLLSIAEKSKDLVNDTNEYYDLWLKSLKSKKTIRKLNKIYNKINVENQIAKLKKDKAN